MTISALSLMCLSLFALEPATDGAFVIRSDNFYGKLFLAINDFYGSPNETSFCPTFWRTNLVILLICALIGLLIGLGAMLWSLGVLGSFAVIGGFLIFILLIAGVAAFCEYCEDRAMDEMREAKAQQRLSTEGKLAIVALILVSIFSVASVVVGFWNLLTGIGIALLAASTAIGAIAILFGIVYGVARLGIVSFGFLSNTQFGKEFGGVYHTYLCPRIRIES